MTSLLQQLLDIGVGEYDARKAVESFEAGNPRRLILYGIVRALWSEVVEEGEEPNSPPWIEQWRELGSNGFPFIAADALERLLSCGVNPADLTDVVRSAQVLALYNVSVLLDGEDLAPHIGEEASSKVSWHLAGGLRDGNVSPIDGFHEVMEDLDPAGRRGAPRTPDFMAFKTLPAEVQKQLHTYFPELGKLRKRDEAIKIWSDHFGTQVDEAEAILKRLKRLFGY